MFTKACTIYLNQISPFHRENLEQFAYYAIKVCNWKLGYPVIHADANWSNTIVASRSRAIVATILYDVIENLGNDN
jgi:hypothetical protein